MSATDDRPFGTAPVRVVVGPVARSGDDDMELVRDALSRLGDVDRPAELNLSEPLRTAAFSRRDRLLPTYDAAVARAARKSPIAEIVCVSKLLPVL